MAPGHTVRDRIERTEDMILAPYAARSVDSQGREAPEVESPLRTAYQRDRDRIIHSHSFRRLRGKTQVFIAPAGDHYATRLSHVLEVSQVARDVSRALRLNEDLTEAIALAHDVGHAPFGHAGQEALDRVTEGGYRHDVQSLRVVRYLERDGKGLNLTAEVLDGIRTHRKPRHDLSVGVAGPATTLEALVVKIADAIAYINHDVDDAMRAGVIHARDLPSAPIAILGTSRSARINTAVSDIVETSLGKPEVVLSPPVLSALNELREYLFQNVYTSPIVKREAERARHIVSQLFHYYSDNPEAMPEEYRRDPRDEGVARRVADYIGGMTDSFAIRAFEDLFIPKMWPV